METSTLSLATSALGVASALAVVALGIVSLGGGRARPRGALAFGLFAVCWGLQILAGSSTLLATAPSMARVAHLALLVLSLPTTYFLVEFAISQLGPKHRLGAQVLRTAAIAVTSLVIIVLFTAPMMIYRGLTIRGDRAFPDWGPLHAPLILVPQFVAFGLALVSLHAALRDAKTPRTARRMSTLFLGLGLYVAFASANNFVFYLGTALGYPELDPDFSLRTLLLTGVFGFLVAIMVSVLGRLLAPNATPRVLGALEHRRMAAFLGAAMAWGAVEAFLALDLFPRLETVGFWRLVGVAVIAYGLARWRTYDLRERATRAAAASSGTAVATVAGVAAFGAGTLATSGPLLPAAAGLVVGGMALIPSVRVARRLFGLDAPKDRPADDDAMYGQRIDAYRAALEASYARESLEEDADFLAALRERFAISEAEDRLLRHYAKSSVIVARDRKAHEAFERLRLLGEGGGGRTWLARDRQRDRLVVLKEPLQQWQQDPQTREGVLREARLAARVRHANVVAVEEVVEGKGSPIIVMEYLEGGSLSDLLRARGTLPWREAVPLILDICRGVEAIHAAGIVHRDVKPSNILLDRDGVPKVADFGIALPVVNTRTILDVGATARAGTLFYMAPEVRAGHSPGDRRADVYACAAVLHECLYGAPPGAHAPVILRSDVPATLTAVMARALAERPEDRIPTVRALAEELAKVLKS